MSVFQNTVLQILIGPQRREIALMLAEKTRKIIWWWVLYGLLMTYSAALFFVSAITLHIEGFTLERMNPDGAFDIPGLSLLPLTLLGLRWPRLATSVLFCAVVIHLAIVLFVPEYVGDPYGPSTPDDILSVLQGSFLFFVLPATVIGLLLRWRPRKSESEPPLA